MRNQSERQIKGKVEKESKNKELDNEITQLKDRNELTMFQDEATQDNQGFFYFFIWLYGVFISILL